MRNRTCRSVVAAHILVALMACSVLASGCVHAPSSLSPKGVADFNNTRVIKSIDLIRDTAVDANALMPPMLSTPTTRKIVEFHRSALLLINAGAGWKAKVLTLLDETVKDLPAGEARIVAPYAALSKVIIQEVGQ